MAGTAALLRWSRLLKSSFLHHNKRCSRSISSSSSNFAAWNVDWKPGPYPKTKEEREAAAKKYGLRVEDYEPYDPYTDPGYGDYPKIKWIGAEARDPYEEFDYPHLGYNYGEVLHAKADMATADRYNPQWEDVPYYSQFYMITAFLSVFLGLFSLHYLCHYNDIKTHMPVMPKQYPDHLWIQRGRDPAKMPKVVHYTFDPVDS